MSAAWLAAAGRRVALLARPRVIEEIEAGGLRLTSFEGLDRKIASSQLTLSDDPAIFGDAGVVLVTVKSADTAEIADIIARHAPADAVIVSLQNGIGNVAVLRERLPGRRVLAAMVPFNVVSAGEGRFHRSTSGDIVIEQDDAGTAARLSVPGLTLRATENIAGVQWGKLLVNLNNALNALSDLPLRRQLAQRPWRMLFADQMAEGLAAIRAEGIKPVSSTPIPASWTPPLLRLPDAIFEALLGRTMKIDPEARSSMWEDLQRGRAHRDRLSARRHHRNRRPARLAGAAVAPHRGADPARRGRRQGFAGTDAGADSNRAAALSRCLEMATIA